MVHKVSALSKRLSVAGSYGASFVTAFESVADGSLTLHPHETRPFETIGDGALVVAAGIVRAERFLADGSRQIGEIYLAGDIIVSAHWNYPRSPWSLAATAAAECIQLSKSAWDALRSNPELGPVLDLIDRLHAARAAERLTSIGRREAIARAAHLLCELWVRGEQAGLTESGYLPLPLTQADLGDATGLTAVHINRTLQRLRREYGIEIGSQLLRPSDFLRLSEVGQFDPSYLLVEVAA